MEIKGVSSNIAIQQPIKIDKAVDEKSDNLTSNSDEKVSISTEAQALYNGGGHPERPKKPTEP
jgi:hypothetical protein